MEDIPWQLRKQRFMFNKRCAYCSSTDNLELDHNTPYKWVPDSVWKLSDYELHMLFVSDIQILCNDCLLRKKRLWKSFKSEGGKWLQPYLKEQ